MRQHPELRIRGADSGFIEGQRIHRLGSEAGPIDPEIVTRDLRSGPREGPYPRVVGFGILGDLKNLDPFGVSPKGSVAKDEAFEESDGISESARLTRMTRKNRSPRRRREGIGGDRRKTDGERQPKTRDRNRDRPEMSKDAVHHRLRTEVYTRRTRFPRNRANVRFDRPLNPALESRCRYQPPKRKTFKDITIPLLTP